MGHIQQYHHSTTLSQTGWHTNAAADTPTLLVTSTKCLCLNFSTPQAAAIEQRASTCTSTSNTFFFYGPSGHARSSLVAQ